MHEYRQILMRMRLGDSDREIARTGLMGRAKVSKLRQQAQAAGWLDPSTALPDDAALAATVKPAPRPSSVSLVEPFADDVRQWWQAGIQGTTIFAALKRKRGFRGSYSSVRRYLAQLEADNPEVTVLLDFEPAEAAQVDFGKGPDIVDPRTGELVPTWIFVMTLNWSRHQYVEFITHQDVETWLGCHRRAFEWFGGVPARVTIDNPKCAITKACYYDPEVQRSYVGCAEGYGFRIEACPPREPKKKGRVESGVKYVKRNFVPLREFRDLTDANEQARAWILSEAGNRVHGSTHELPLARFEETEKHLLRPLPDRAPELLRWTLAKVHGSSHVQFEKCQYSVPFKYVRHELWLSVSETTVQIFKDHQMVASHPRLFCPGQRHTVEDHLPPNARAYLSRDPQWCLAQAKAIGPYCLALIERLFEDQVLHNLRAAQGVIGLEKRFGEGRLEAACERAMRYDNPRFRTVKTILNNGLDLQPVTPGLFDTSLNDTYTGGGRFIRKYKDQTVH